jgi:hypothetical protein
VNLLGPPEQIPPEVGDKIQSPKCCVLNKKRTMDNVQKHNICINIPLHKISDLIVLFEKLP